MLGLREEWCRASNYWTDSITTPARTSLRCPNYVLPPLHCTTWLWCPTTSTTPAWSPSNYVLHPLHYLALMSYYFYNSSVESPKLCTTSTALLGEVPRTTTSNALHYLALLSYYFSTLSIHGPVTLGTDPPTFPSSTFNSTSSHFTWPVAGLSLSRNGK